MISYGNVAVDALPTGPLLAVGGAQDVGDAGDDGADGGYRLGLGGEQEVADQGQSSSHRVNFVKLEYNLECLDFLTTANSQIN